MRINDDEGFKAFLRKIKDSIKTDPTGKKKRVFDIGILPIMADYLQDKDLLPIEYCNILRQENMKYKIFEEARGYRDNDIYLNLDNIHYSPHNNVTRIHFNLKLYQIHLTYRH